MLFSRIPLAVAAALLAAGSSHAASFIHLAATNPLNVSGSVSTVTVTLTIDGGGLVLPGLGVIAVQVGWDNTVVRVVGSNGTTTFGKSSQSALLTTSSGTISSSLTPGCASAGPTKGKVCTTLDQSSAVGATVNPNQVVTGTLLLEVLPSPGGPDPVGTPLGLTISQYHRLGITNPAADPNLTISPSFPGAHIVPEPATAALVALGLAGLGARRRRASDGRRAIE